MEDIRDKYNEMLDNFNKLIKESDIRSKELNKELSNLDLAKSDILHYIELEKFNAVKGFAVLRKLKCVLQQRREVKNEMLKIQQVTSRVNEYKVILNKKLTNIEDKKKYTYKTDILSDIGFTKESQSSREI